MDSAVAIVHARYSTNTFPSWPLAQPFRAMCHNGEINTLRGNINKFMARRSMLAAKAFNGDIKKADADHHRRHERLGHASTTCSSCCTSSGRSLPHAILMMIPEAWGDKYYMGHDRRGFYEYHANFMEPWDGPAAILFTDGVQSGGILDRNGLRPLRYTITKNDLLVLGSETGALRDRPGRHPGPRPPAPRQDDDRRHSQTARAEQRRSQGRDHPPAALPALGGSRPHRVPGLRHRRRRDDLRRRHTTHPPDRLRIHARGLERPHPPDGLDRQRADRLDGQRHAAGCAVRPAAAWSSATSGSCSPRSPTRPSIPSARSW